MDVNRGPTPREWWLIAAGCLGAGLMSFAILATTSMTEGWDQPLLPNLVLEIDATLMVLALLPFVLLFMRKTPITAANWWKSIPAHLAASVVFGASHTLLLWGSRTLIWRILGWGRFDYGAMPQRFLMEYTKQFLVYLAIFLVVMLVQYQRRRRAAALKTARLEQQLSGARLENLRAQLAPHFIFNTLNMIAAKVHDDPDLADDMIGRLSDFLRMTLQDTDRIEVPLERELHYLDAYLAIMRARFADRLEARVTIPDEMLDAALPHLVLQPLVENAIKHGSRQHGRTEVHVQAFRRDEHLVITVDDNGPGLDPTANGNQGLGLANTRQRLEEIHGAEAQLVLADTGHGCRVTLTVPWRTIEEEVGDA